MSRIGSNPTLDFFAPNERRVGLLVFALLFGPGFGLLVFAMVRDYPLDESNQFEWAGYLFSLLPLSLFFLLAAWSRRAEFDPVFQVVCVRDYLFRCFPVRVQQFRLAELDHIQCSASINSSYAYKAKPDRKLGVVLVATNGNQTYLALRLWDRNFKAYKKCVEEFAAAVGLPLEYVEDHE